MAIICPRSSPKSLFASHMSTRKMRWDSPDDKKSFKRWSWAQRMQVTHRQKWEDWRKRAFGVGTEAWKITWCLWKAWEQGRTRSHCNGRPRWKDTVDQLAGALSGPPTSGSSLVSPSGSGNRKEFKPILRYIQSLDHLTESAWDFLFSNPCKQKKTTIWSFWKPKAAESSVGRSTMPGAHLAVHNEAHKPDCVAVTSPWH